MRSFRDFLASHPITLEISSAPMSFSGSTRYPGHFNFPDLRNLHEPGHVPAGGYGNISQFVQSQKDKMQYSNVDAYLRRNILEKMATLAEQAYSVYQEIKSNPQGQEELTFRKYRLIDFKPQQGLITGFGYNGLINQGGYPEIRPQEIDYAIQMGVFIPDPNPPHPSKVKEAGFAASERFYAMSINNLYKAMEDNRDELMSYERGFRSWDYLAGKGDEILGAASAGGMVPMTKAVNPLIGR